MGFSIENTSNNVMTYTHVKKVAIVGAGVGGLQLAERLCKVDGMQVTIFEQTSKVGGVWSANYADFGLQVPKELYEFPTFPYPADKKWDRFPKGPAVQSYIEAFVEHFSLSKVIKFNTTVVGLEPLEGGWLVDFVPSGTSTGMSIQEHFDFVVVATGMYSGASPHMPAHPGKESFNGKILHSYHFTNRQQAHGKRVVVIGGGKSSVDCAVAAVNGGANNVTLLFRSAHWPVPRYILDFIPFKFATYSRFGHALLPTHHDVSSYVWWLHALFTPLKWVIWRLVELIFRYQFHLPREMHPTSRIEIDVFTGGQILTYEARDMIRSGKLKICKDEIKTYTPDGVELQCGNAPIPCDLVIYGTGFTKNYDYLSPKQLAKLCIQSDGLYLYRSMLPINLPGLAFLGSEVSTFNNILTHGLQAAWLSKLLVGDLTLPTHSAMQRAVETEMNWKRTWMPSTSARAAIQQLHMPKYHDVLVTDMGHPACRKSNPLFEIFLPYNARDYRSIFGLPDRTIWMRLKTTLLLLVFLWLKVVDFANSMYCIVGVATCVIVFLLPEEPPCLLSNGPLLCPKGLVPSRTHSSTHPLELSIKSDDREEGINGPQSLRKRVHSPHSPLSELAMKNSSPRRSAAAA